MTSRPRVLAAPLRGLLVGAAALFLASNLLMAAVQIALIVAGSDALDWNIYVAATERYPTGELYARAEWWYGWRYSPVAVYAFLPVAPIGEAAWRLLLLAALFALPPPLPFLGLASYPFWFALHAGNIIVLVVVVAYWALRGRGWAIGIFLGLALLVPRPLMVPIVIWLLWKHPAWRWGFGVLFALHAVAVVATGYLPAWLATLARTTEQEVAGQYNVAPSALVGIWWMLAAVPLAIVAFRAQRPALSGLLLQPYWLPYYLLVVLADQWPQLKEWRQLTGWRTYITSLGVPRDLIPFPEPPGTGRRWGKRRGHEERKVDEQDPRQGNELGHGG